MPFPSTPSSRHNKPYSIRSKMTKPFLIALIAGAVALTLAAILLAPPIMNAAPTEEAPGLMTDEPVWETPLVDEVGEPVVDPYELWYDYPPVVQKGKKYLPSTISFYQGEGYSKKWNKCRLSIRQAESRNVYGAISAKPSQTYKGAYQFSDAFAVGMGWMIQKSMREQGAPKEQAFQIGAELRATPAHRWGAFWQEWGFWMGWDDGKGKHHWPNTRRHSSCP